MNQFPSIQAWQIGPVELKLIVDSAGVGDLDHQTPDCKLLRTLAASGVQGVAACSLDIVFQWGFRSRDVFDALAAYSYCPFETPPAQYLEEFRKVDWSSPTPPQALYAIILAGSNSEVDKELLLQILRTLNSDFRDGALFAASSFSDLKFIQTVASLALTTCEDEAFATGEMHGFLFCFKRWLDANVLSIEELEQLFISLATAQPCRMSWRRLMNYIVCRDWSRLPFPEEYRARVKGV
jgi:hypothetical protein